MSTNRLLFIAALVFCLIGASVPGQTQPLGAETKPPGHPRLLLLKGEEETIRRTIGADQAWNKVHQAIIVECATINKAAPLERIQTGRRLLSVSREALRRIFFLSYAWRMTRQAEYLKRAEQELLAVSAFSDWNPSHFLDVAEMTIAVAIGYDWLHEGLSPQSRAVLKEAILKKGIEPSQDTKHNSWLRASHNWNQVCNAGITYGALAIYEDEPELARSLVNRAIESVVLAMHDYKPDGAYPEGYSYWGYGTSFNVMLISAIERAFGQDYGLANQPGFLKTAGYLQNMTGPTGDSFNYSDAGPGGSLQPAMFWFANRLKNPSLLWVERNRLMAGDTKEVTQDRLGPAVLVWSAGLDISRVREPQSLLWVGQGKNPVALMRGSWTDPAAVFVGFKAGSPSVNHGHMDVGSFVMEADGVRWAMDLGMQNYNSLEAKGVKLWGMSQDAQRWQVYRYNNFAHNTLTVNDSLQTVKGYASIKSTSNAPAFLNATTDLTSLYGGALAKANRGIAIVDKAYVVVRDELETSSADATVRWTMATSAAVKLLDGNRAKLEQNGKKLLLQVAEPAKVTLTTAPADPSHEYDAPNPGVTLVSFQVQLPAGTKAPMTVLLIPEKAASAPRSAVKPLEQWPR